jgi:hypothetical protein
MTFVEDVVLREIEDRVVIFMDEIDSALSLPFSDDFFTTLRSLYNARASNPILNRLTFVLLGVATASAFSKDRSRTPFNIGYSVALEDFDQTSTEHFQEVLGPGSDALVDRIFYWTNGQPFLVQKLAATAFAWPQEDRSSKQIDAEVKHAYLQRKVEQDTHLKFIRDYVLAENANLGKTLKTYLKVLQDRDVPHNEQSTTQSRLKLAGVVRVEDNKLVPRNRIYSSIFNQQWAKAHIPRETRKKVVYGLATVLALVFVWTALVQPLFFPRFPQIPKIIKYTAEPSVEFELSVAAANVSKAFLDEKEIQIQQGSVIRERLGSLPVGESTHELKLVGGFLRNPTLSPSKSPTTPTGRFANFQMNAWNN